MAAGKRHPASEVWGGGQEELPASEANGGREETPSVRAQGRLGEATSHPRPGAVILRSHPEPEARAGGREEQPEELVATQAQEGLEELSHVEGQERRW